MRLTAFLESRTIHERVIKNKKDLEKIPSNSKRKAKVNREKGKKCIEKREDETGRNPKQQRIGLGTINKLKMHVNDNLKLNSKLEIYYLEH
jgi:hypothetical protein